MLGPPTDISSWCYFTAAAPTYIITPPSLIDQTYTLGGPTLVYTIPDFTIPVDCADKKWTL